MTQLHLSPAWRSWFVEPLAALLLVFGATTAIAQPFYVPSGSMEPTLQIGDAFVASKFPYGYSRYSLPYGAGPASQTRLMGRLPARGDVVVFRLPRNPQETLVKRVIGLPGDTVQMVGGHLMINGKVLPLIDAGTGLVEEADGRQVPVPRFTEILPNGVRHAIFKWRWDGMVDDTAPMKIPAGHLFMMGDNRDNSLDSRVPARFGGVGLVPVENLVGRAEIVVGSYDFLNARAVLGWLSSFRLSRLFYGVV